MTASHELLVVLIDKLEEEGQKRRAESLRGMLVAWYWVDGLPPGAENERIVEPPGEVDGSVKRSG